MYCVGNIKLHCLSEPRWLSDVIDSHMVTVVVIG